MTEFTVELINKALDATLMRQNAIASNVANSNTLDYQSIEVEFEQYLELSAPLDTTDSAAIKPRYVLGNKRSSLDEQMVLNVQNSTHFRALIKGLNQKFAIMKLAMLGGNQ